MVNGKSENIIVNKILQVILFTEYKKKCNNIPAVRIICCNMLSHRVDTIYIYYTLD